MIESRADVDEIPLPDSGLIVREGERGRVLARRVPFAKPRGIAEWIESFAILSRSARRQTFDARSHALMPRREPNLESAVELRQSNSELTSLRARVGCSVDEMATSRAIAGLRSSDDNKTWCATSYQLARPEPAA